MDKPSERKKDSKDWGDTDVDTMRDFKAGGKRAELGGLWDYAPKEVVGQGLDRLVTTNFCKEAKGGEPSADELADKLLNSGTPIVNASKVQRIL